MIRFYSKIGYSESKVIFKWRKNNKNSQNSHRTTQTNSQQIVNKQKSPPWACDKGAQKLAQNVFPPWRPTLTSRSLQSIARPFQKRFCEVFGNARILIFYLSKKAWEEESHLAWFFLVFDEGKVTKENISIFWFIWPLRGKQNKPSSCWILE